MAKYLSSLLAFLMLVSCGGPGETGQDADQTGTQKAGVSTDAVTTGVTLELAAARKAVLSNVNYALTFKVPAPQSEDQAITGVEVLTFELSAAGDDLQLDFRENGDKIRTVNINGERVRTDHRAEHLILPQAALKPGANTVHIEFIAGDASLNRNPGYLYTLFVPDRARTAFPVFDQPNLKATYDLTLDLPEGWAALSNGRRLAKSPAGDGRQIHTFATTDKLSSYLFSFVAGEFQTITRTLNGREMTMLHRETDEAKLERNVDEIFQAHADALVWLEDYTGIDYPFQKFDFALIPTFQYGGMEHVGAIQYRASTLLLVEDPSDPQKLARANLIAHETAHMWFGNLVTMDWFNDVWTKEVFANFMAAKIVNPSFPEIDHDLNFLLRSYPAAYAVDRTEGANPIRQNLPNLNEAGTLYGGIIYNKAPIMMKQLELLIGEEAFQSGIREYLSTFAGRNATWPDLIDILDKRSDQDLKAWSEVWVNTPGRPHYVFSKNRTALKQLDPAGEGRAWDQQFSSLGSAGDNSGTTDPAVISSATLLADADAPSLEQGSDILINSNGAGYGLFPVDLVLADQVWTALSDLQKGAQLINLFEQMLEGHEEVRPADYIAFLARHVDEENELVLNTLLGQVRRIYWSFLSAEEADEIGAQLEGALWRHVRDDTNIVSTRRLHLATLQDISRSDAMIERLKSILAGEGGHSTLVQSDRARERLASLLALKRPEDANTLIEEHLKTLKNPDEKRRFKFIAPALSPDVGERDAFFARLRAEENRAIESWVVDALFYLHHPLQTGSSEKYLLESLELMEEIQVTGDIFFPARWINGTLSNHRSASAAKTVRDFLAARPDYNYQLRLKILQGADMLFRAAEHQKRAAP